MIGDRSTEEPESVITGQKTGGEAVREGGKHKSRDKETNFLRERTLFLRNPVAVKHLNYIIN